MAEESKEEKKPRTKRRKAVVPKRRRATAKKENKKPGIEKLPPEILELVDWFGSVKDAAKAAESGKLLADIRKGLVQKCQNLTENGTKCPQLLRRNLPVPAHVPIEHGCYTWCEVHLRDQIQERLFGAFLTQPLHWRLEEGIEFKMDPLTKRFDRRFVVEFAGAFPGSLHLGDDFVDRHDVIHGELVRRYSPELLQRWEPVLNAIVDLNDVHLDIDLSGPDPEPSMYYAFPAFADKDLELDSPEIGKVLTMIAIASPLFVEQLFSPSYPYPPSPQRKAIAKAFDKYPQFGGNQFDDIRRTVDLLQSVAEQSPRPAFATAAEANILNNVVQILYDKATDIASRIP